MSVDGRDVVIDKLAGDEVPWYLDIDLNWYIENFSKQYYEAVELSKQVQKFLSYNDGERTAYADGFARELGVSQRTLYRYSQSYLEAAAWAMKLEKMECGNYDFLRSLPYAENPRRLIRSLLLARMSELLLLEYGLIKILRLMLEL
jgi:hypothetical protein